MEGVKASHTLGGAGEWGYLLPKEREVNRDERFVSGRGECVRVKL